MAAVGFEPPTSRSGVRHSTTEPPRSPVTRKSINEEISLKGRDVSVRTILLVV